MNDSRGDNCKDMRELLSAYHDAELNSSERTIVEEHLSTCSDCRDELAAVQSVVSSLKSLPAVTLSKDYSVDIESLVKRAEAGKTIEQKTVDNVVSISKAKKKPLGLIAAAAAAVVVLMVATYLGTTGGGGSIVATGTGGTPPTIAAKDEQPVKRDTGSEQTPVVADSDIASGTEDVASTNAPNTQAVASKPDTNAVRPDITEGTPSKTNAPIIAEVKPIAAKQNRVIQHVDDLADNQALVAFSDPYDDSEIFEDSGISTDEDGLYAIKM